MKLLEFSVQNYRSIKERESLTLMAEASKSKSDNVFEASVRKKETTDYLRVLKTAVLYGANASGKSNFIKAIAALQWLATRSNSLTVGKSIKVYTPFKLDSQTMEAPIVFSIVFLIEEVKYAYNICFTEKIILEETLDFYPAGKPANLFKRLASKEVSDFTTVSLGTSLKDKNIPKNIFNNQAYLSKFGADIPHQQLTAVFKYFDGLQIWNALNSFDVVDLCRKISKKIANGNDEPLRQRLSQLIRVADTRIEEVRAVQLQEDNFQFPDSLPTSIREEVVKQNSLRTVAVHQRYEQGTLKDTVEFDLLDEESEGTKVLFALGGIIIEMLEEGGILFFDELDNSLHPDLCKFLIRLFNNPVSNPKGAQLVFATHEITLLDKAIFRKDQLWFTQKDKFGATILYSAKEIDGVREDTNFESRYRAGKFGGRPKLKELQFIYPNA